MKRTARVFLLLVLVLPSWGFKPRYHEEFTREALKDIARTIAGRTIRFTNLAIDQIVKHDVNQDNGWCVVGQPQPPFAVSANHFDGEQLAGGSAEIQKRLKFAQESLRQPKSDGEAARRLLGQVLHATQDYYAHTNWAETHSATAPDVRLGSATFNAVSIETQTCEAPPNTDRYLPFVGQTSGYWFGCFGRDDAQLPPNKCYHGLELSGVPGSTNYAGTNKDTPTRPYFDVASQLAVQSSRAVIEKLLDSDGIRGNAVRTAALMGITTIGFVIDTKQQVHFEGIKNGIRTAVEAIDQGDDPHEYLSVVYGMGFSSIRRPPGTNCGYSAEVSVDGEPFTTTDPAAFLAEVENNVCFTGASYGEDACGTNSESALLKAINASLPDSQIFLITDEREAEPYWENDASSVSATVNALAKARNIKITPILTGTCSPIDPIYRTNAAETGGGIFYQDIPDNLLEEPAGQALAESFISAVVPTQVDARADLALRTGENVGPPPGVLGDHTVQVDSDVSEVTFAVTGDYPAGASSKIAIRRPDSSLVKTTDAEVSWVDYSGSAVVKVGSPMPGTWHVYPAPGTRSLSVKAIPGEPADRLEFVEYGNPAHPGFFPIEGSPVQGEPATVLIHTRESALQLFAVDPQTGVLLKYLGQAQAHPDGGDDALVSTFTLPETAFRILMKGASSQRILPETIQPQSVKIAPWGNNPDLVLEHQTARLGFALLNKASTVTRFELSAASNYWVSGLYWGEDEEGILSMIPGDNLVEGVSPAVLTLEPNATGVVYVDLRPAPDPHDGAPIKITLFANAHGEPQMNSSTVYLPEPRWMLAAGVLLLLCLSRTRHVV